MTTIIADKIIHVLQHVCGWEPSSEDVEVFRQSLLENKISEYRFMGKLGFGGKLYKERRGFRVNCYTEDKSVEKDYIIFKANNQLRHL